MGCLERDIGPEESIDRAPASRICAHPIRYQRDLIPADALYLADAKGAWLKVGCLEAPNPGVKFGIVHACNAKSPTRIELNRPEFRGGCLV